MIGQEDVGRKIVLEVVYISTVVFFCGHFFFLKDLIIVELDPT